jgi:enoyl-CoA hydratase/carnithine racemase
MGKGMEAIELEQHDGVALVRLNRGVINAINSQVIQEVGEVLRLIKSDAGACGLVLTSANAKFFSIGFDLPEIYPLPPEAFAAFLRAYNLLCLELYTFPKPVVSAITGHATAGGCIMALCADYRYMAEGRTLIGMNESKLGVPITSLADGRVRQLVGERHARAVIDQGELYGPEEALQMGMVDGVFPPEEVVPAAIKKARALGEISPFAYAMNKDFRVRGIAAHVLSHLEEDERAFTEQWYAPLARQRLKEAMGQFAPRGQDNV